MFKKLISLLLTLSMIVSMGFNVFASESNINESSDFKEYTKMIDEGVLEDISFEYWQELKAESARLEEGLEKSTEFENVYDSRSRSSYSMKKGDVLVTNATSSYGLTGHAGIAISSTQILHIEGPNKLVTVISLNTWNRKYTNKGWTKIYRHSSTSVANAAGDWANRTYRGSKAKYVINTDLASTNKTYCSKIVWQAYYYGPSKANANGPTFGVRLPYQLDSTIHNLRKVVTL